MCHVEKRWLAAIQPWFSSVVAGMLVALLGLSWTAAQAQRVERSGKAVVDAACASCHARADKGAPRIGDHKAWAARASQGLSVLTATALKGIRNMPAHGGSPGLSDIEIERAITYMVNRSGGHWVEPMGGAGPAVVRSGQQLVQAQCAKCHQDGLNGAPRIGDRAAWAPRLAKGLQAVVRTAVNGHGGMPARGGLATATDAEIQGAIVYMFNFGVPAPPPPQPVAAADPYHKVVDGIEVYLGVVRAEAAPAGAGGQDVPRGKGYFHLNVSLFDAASKAAITDAKVKVEVSDPTSMEARVLAPLASGGVVSYGGYFRMRGPDRYVINAQIERPGAGRVSEARFEYRVW